MTESKEEKSTGIKAEQALIEKLKTIRSVAEATGQEIPINEINFHLSRNVLHEELGYFGEFSSVYTLSNETKTVLLVHGRQDASYAAANTSSILKELQEVRVTIRRQNYLLIFCALLLLVGFFALS